MSENVLDSHASTAVLTNVRIQSGQAPKQHNGQLSVNFPEPFSSTPVVIVSPYWPNGQFVTDCETINSISTTGFVVNSNNSSDNIQGNPYFVEWIAVGGLFDAP